MIYRYSSYWCALVFLSMNPTPSLLHLAELGFSYAETPQPWVAVLVDCPHIEAGQGVFTYAIPETLTVKDGDIVSVPFGSQQLGGIVIGSRTTLPPTLTPDKVKPIDSVVMSGFFSPHYWHLLHWVGEYYCTELITVIRMALPPGLLERSQRRIRLQGDRLPDEWSLFLTQASQRPARQIIQLLQQSQQGDYSYRYLKQKVKGLNKGLQDLLKRQWVDSYLEPPKAIRAQQPKMVTLLDTHPSIKLTPLQQATIAVLRNHGGELWLAQLLKTVPCSGTTVTSLEKKGLVAIGEREKLRQLSQPTVTPTAPPTLTTAQRQACEKINALHGYHQISVTWGDGIGQNRSISPHQ